MNFIDKPFGRLTLLREVSPKVWLCGCYCGNYRTARIVELMRSKVVTLTCGKCYDRKKYPTEYNIWVTMNQRCYNKNTVDYPRYGGRGITVCRRWRHDFLYFLEDVGFRPYTYMSLDRKNNDGNYEPENCRWATPIQQANNRSTTLLTRGAE